MHHWRLPIYLALGLSGVEAFQLQREEALRKAEGTVVQPAFAVAASTEHQYDSEKHKLDLSQRSSKVRRVVASLYQRVRDGTDFIYLALVMVIAIFFYLVVWSAFQNDKTTDRVTTRVEPKVAMQHSPTPADKNLVISLQRSMVPAISRAFVGQCDVWPLLVPLDATRGPPGWTIHVLSNGHKPLFQVRLRERQEYRDRILEILERGEVPRDFASVTSALKLLSSGGAQFGTLEDATPKGAWQALLELVLKGEEGLPRMTIESHVSGHGMDFFLRPLHPVADPMAMNAPRKPVVSVKMRTGTIGGVRGQFMELTTTDPSVDPVLFVTCALAVVVFVPPLS